MVKFGPNAAQGFLVILKNLSAPGDFSALGSVLDRVKMLGLGRLAGLGWPLRQAELENRMHPERMFF